MNSKATAYLSVITLVFGALSASAGSRLEVEANVPHEGRYKASATAVFVAFDRTKSACWEKVFDPWRGGKVKTRVSKEISLEVQRSGDQVTVSVPDGFKPKSQACDWTLNSVRIEVSKKGESKKKVGPASVDLYVMGTDNFEHRRVPQRLDLNCPRARNVWTNRPQNRCHTKEGMNGYYYYFRDGDRTVINFDSVGS